MSLPLLLWRRFTVRHWRQAPAQSAVLVLILALGIGVFFAMRLANRAVLERFESFTDVVSQESDWVVTSPAGSLPESVLREVRGFLGDRPVSLMPVLEITGAAPSTGEADRAYGLRRVYNIIGVDLAALANLAIPNAAPGPAERAWLMRGPGEFWSVFRNPRAAYVGTGQAGDRLPVVIHDRTETLEIAGVLPRAPEGLVVMDLPSVQRLARTPGRIGRIECLIEPGAEAARYRAETRALLLAHAQGRWLVSSPNERREGAAQMTAALRLNLTLLSTLALLVGFYFIYQALDGAVVRRREEIATLRSLGVTEWSIRQAWLLEAVALGLAGGSLGGVLGWLGAQGTVRLVSRSVNALYQSSHVEHAAFVASEFALSLLLGVGFSVIAGWFPARDAARTPPAQALRRHAGTVLAKRGFGRVLVGGVIAALAASAPPLRLAGGTVIPLGGYISTLACVLTAAAGMGALLAGLSRLLQPLAARSVPLRLALSQLRRPTLRHVIAGACLLSAVAMAGAMAVLIGSYDLTMREWLTRTFLSDLYISSEGAQSASSTNRLPPETWKPLAADPAVADFYAVQITPIVFVGTPTLLAGGDLAFLGRQKDWSWLVRPGREVFDPAGNAALALVSEAFTRRYQKKVGDEIALPTPSGEKRVRLAGVFADYGNERGTVLIDRRQFTAWWGHELIATLTLQLRPGFAPEAVRARFREVQPGLNIFTNRALREQALRVFHETFSVTYALEIIGVTVAVTGLGLTLASIFLQRRGDLATLRALAWSRREIAQAAAAEGLLLAAAGLVSGLLASLILGALLVFVVNRQSFGWTLQYHVPWPALALLSALVLGSGAATAYLVGRWAAQLPGDREE